MKRTQCIAVAAVIVGTSLGVQVARAQQSGIKRTDLQQHDLGIAGREVVQVRVDFDSGAAFGKHTPTWIHPTSPVKPPPAASLQRSTLGFVHLG